MRRIRLAVVGIFVLSLIAFIVFNIVNRVTTDSTPPVITSESDTVTVSVAAEESELLAGLTAADDEDGDLTGEIMISSMSNFTEPGKRTISYVVFDASNNASTLTRNLEYTDYTAPQIKLTQPLRYSLNEMEDASLTENMSVQDCLDGDITQQIRATFNDGSYIAMAGEYGITVQVSNSAGDTCSVPLTVTVTDPAEESGKYYPMLSDYIVYAPVGGYVDLTSLLIGLENSSTQYLFADANPSAPGGIESVAIGGAIDYNTPGTYTVDYQFTSASGATGTTKLAVVVG
ncbi:MAG TPA: hypothetical protein H9757_11360 [Candidatus Mediterraneibacter faecigallinarum]|uniref:Pesticidal crystal protein Cry22Aa Ig-like domain-containing protein n=1 Tax=Candidatus Mediterraneibacter faecigallinarum TaxID=2838669 RepID=A0A9D2NZ03_9FIRM|nr:hypothetical protein [Candidatus Mediterraneibacter faecigallinarum]